MSAIPSSNDGQRSLTPQKLMRSSRACQGCRLAKAKCESVTNESKCRRCLVTSSQCHFAVSRRGRVKGSRNRRTLEKLGQVQCSSVDEPCDTRRCIQVAASAAARVPNGSGENRVTSCRPQACQDYCQSPYSCDPEASFNEEDSEHADEDAADLHRGPHQRSRAPTPWNPQHLAVSVECSNDQNRPQLARKLQHILGEFPAVHGKENDKAGDSKNFREPLWMLLGLIEKGYDLQHAEYGEKKPSEDDPVTPPAPFDLPEDDAFLLSRWTPQAFEEMEQQQMEYIRYGFFGSKHDVAEALDPINHGLLTEERARELFDVFWDRYHPQWPVLDQEFHTLDKVRSRSALLTSTILAVASTLRNYSPDRTDEEASIALRLHAHVEKLNLVIFASAARSVEIIQAHLILTRWGICPKTRLDDQRWIRTAMIPRMASEIGLNLPRYDGDHGLDPEEAEVSRRNDIRTRAFMIISEHRFHTGSGRPVMDTSQFELSDDEVDEITRHAGDIFPTGLAASWHLVMIDRNVRNRINSYSPGHQASLSLSAELEHTKSQIELWIRTWCGREGNTPQLDWHLRHDALGCWLLLVVCIARARLQFHKPTGASRHTHQQQLHYRHHHQEQQRLLRSLSLRLFEDALAQDPQTVCTTHRGAIFSFAAAIILKLAPEKRGMILRMALRLSCLPGKLVVHSFVREAGVQMLMLLRRNGGTHPGPAPRKTGRQEGSRSSVTPETPRAQATPYPAETTDRNSEEVTNQDTNTQVQCNGQVCSTTCQVVRNGGSDLQPFIPQHPVAGPGQQPCMGEGRPDQEMQSLFPYDITDLPYVPYPNQHLEQVQFSDLGHYYPSDVLDAVVGSLSPQSFSNPPDCGRQEDGLPIQQGMHASHEATAVGMEYGGLSSMVQQGIQQSQIQPSQDGMAAWRLLQTLTPSSGGTTFQAGTGTGEGQGRNGPGNNPQKEVLMATVSWLTQIASLMQ